MGKPATIEPVHTEEQQIQAESQSVLGPSGPTSAYPIWTPERVCAVIGFLLVPILLLTFSHTALESVIGVLAQLGLIFWFHKGRHTVHHANR